MSNITQLSETKRALLEKFISRERVQTVTATNVISRRTPGNHIPLSFGQQQLWLLAQLITDTPVYNECVNIHLPGPLNVDAFERSLNEFIRRHEIWRTSFPLVDGLPVQIVHPSLTFTLPVVDLRHLPKNEREAEALRLASEEASIHFDLSTVPLLRPLLIRLDDEEHRLFLTLHHIIFDGVSVYQVFLPEIYAIYKAFSNGQPSPLPELPIQYADYAQWQREQLQENEFVEPLAYWKKQLKGAPAALELPTDHPRPPKTHHGSMRPFALSKPLTDALKMFSRQEGVTLYMTLVAAFKTLLYRYTGQEDMLIGTVTADRNYLEVQRIMGFFLNTLVLRSDLSGNPTFSQLVKRVREVILDALGHQEVPFEYLVKELQPERNLGQNPLFQELITLVPPVPLLPSGWTLSQMDIRVGGAKFDLYLELEDRPEGLIGRFVYNTDLFNDETIARMVGHWQMLLEGIVANPAQHIADLPILTEEERKLLLVEWNDTKTDYPRNRCIQQLFEIQVERTPDAVAVVCENEQLTYRELNSKANRLAHHLQKQGVGPEVLVGVCMERSLDMIVGLLGILKAGGAYVPLDPAYPEERLAFMLQDAQVGVLLTRQRLVKKLPHHMAKLVCFDRDWSIISQQPDIQPTSQTTSEQLAYVIYTSGSTGRPKGVAIVHRSSVAFIHWAMSAFSPEELAGVLASTSICFDLSIFELFVPLSIGGTVILAENVLQLPGLHPKRQITLINTVPSAMAELLRSRSIPNSVRTVNLAGEPLSHALAQQIYQQETIQRVFNLYGPSEDTTYSTYALIEKGEREPTIGRPIANTQIYILDTHLQPVPIGVVGEIYIGGDGLARGYLHHSDLTTERFIPHPFSQQSDIHLYKTGDLARYMPDGAILFVGRKDHQVKLRGFRIELGEIEEVLRQHPLVQEAVVMLREDIPGDKHLVAYLVQHREREAIVADIRDVVKKQLPQYMVPSSFVLLKALPLTPNGKVDRNALPPPDISRLSLAETFVAPRSTTEQVLADIWAQLLRLDHVGVHDNFFELGGDSILAMQIVARAHHAGLHFMPKHLVQYQTIAELAIAVTSTYSDSKNTHFEQKAIHSLFRSPVVAIQTHGSLQPFFFLHGDYQNGASYCFRLARDLEAGQPFYAVDPYRLEDLPFPPSLEDMAAVHNTAMRALQPEGPYLLGGFCNGGLVAYEMAQQLREQGQMVGLLALFDPHPVTYHRWIRRIIAHIGKLVRLTQEQQLYCFLWLSHLHRYLQHLSRYLQLPPYRRLQAELDYQMAYRNGGVILDWKIQYEHKLNLDMSLEMDGLAKSSLKNTVFTLLKLRTMFPDALFPPMAMLNKDYLNMFCWSAAGYEPGRYPGKSTFFFTWESRNRKEDAFWLRIAKMKIEEIEVHLIDGTHTTCKTTYLRGLTKILRMCLRKAQRTMTS